MREDLRPVRFQLELLKPELFLNEANIGSTFVFYGSARIPSPDMADALVAAATNAEQQAVAERLKAKSRYYEVARELAKHASRCGCDEDGKRHFVVCSGGGPSIMEAANRGAWEEDRESIALNIVLPHEQLPNRYVTPGAQLPVPLFCAEKDALPAPRRARSPFSRAASARFDEMFELLTLVQTGKVRPLPILLFGRDFWSRMVNFEGLAEEGVISPHDLDLIHWSEDADEAWDFVSRFYEEHPHPMPVQTAPPE